MIPSTFIQDLLNRVDIVDVVGRYVKLKKGGANFMGLCPFHNEKSSSFSVSPTKQFYHCFGCGAHGSALGFLMEFSGLSFPEAVRDLAQSVGMMVPEEDSRIAPAERAQTVAKSVELVELLYKAMDYYRAQLRASERAIGYLKGRGLTGEVAARFGLGYAPDAWQSLEAVFENYDDPALIESGMVIDKETDSGSHRHYDRFRDRIMFPIRSTKGQVIGFGGRILDAGEPKYLNSPETPVFQKGQELYGLFEARSAVREFGYAIVVEGYMDVVALAQLGFPNAVATLGTACTPMHVQKLIRQTDRVVFSFDGDAAGRKAAWRALEASLPHAADNKTFSFLFLPPEHDPDSFIRENGNEAFAAEIDASLPLSAFLLRELCSGKDMTSAEGRAKALFEATPLLSQLPLGALRLQIVRELARLAQTTPEEVSSLAGLPAIAQATRRSPPRSRRAAPASIEEQIMRLLLLHPALVHELDAGQLAALAAADLPAMDSLVEVCRNAGPGASLGALAGALYESAESEQFAQMIQQAMLAAEIDRDVADQDLSAAIAKMRSAQIKIELDELARGAGGGETNPETAARIRHLMEQQAQLRRPRPEASG